MGAIAGEELLNWEKMQVTDSREEKILVSVRLRPLSEKEIAMNEVADWECINDTTILYRNTLRVGSTFPNAYRFDRVFRGDCSTKQVYEEGAREIALSVVSGINSSIFAYGQTSSGKTYTMIGITEHTVADIFDYIHRHEERAFVLKLSAIEIYNEAVKDLLSTDNTPLRLLDDPERGTIVERITEETLRDWNHLKELLSVCEAQRRIGETSLNEKSSRSHQIIKLTIESSAREFLGKGNSTTLTASVNFVDLAGSERASQALSAGARLKEGCHINRSLLTLGTVIRKLSKGRQGHINYRDSKLTRILQPCLGGNARTAIICTLSPARSHVELTRNTLLFACCAKEVSTKAQVNIVMSDKALVKHLQKELARLESELKSPITGPLTCDYTALLRKKDLQIQKMEKDIRELTKQRDLAQSRVEDLLLIIGDHKDSKPRNSQGSTWEDDYSASASESSTIADRQSLDANIRRFNNPHFYDEDSESNPEETYRMFHEKTPDHYLSDETSLSLNRMKFVTYDLHPNQGGTPAARTENSDDCEEVECIVESSREKSTEPLKFGMLACSALEQRLLNAHMTVDSLVSPYPNGAILLAEATDMSNSRSLKVHRSWSCRATLMAGSSSPEKEERTPSHGFENGYPGKSGGFQRKLPPLNLDTRFSRFDSQSSVGAVQSIKNSADDITSLDTFVTGMKKMAKLEYGKQLVDGQETGLETDKSLKNVKDAGMNPMREESESLSDWPQEFEKKQRLIIELWKTCNVSLVHRTYFFLLFRGDSTDSIYMEVELRRLTFLKETFSHRNQTVEDGQNLTLTSSKRALRREREMLRRLMQRRFSEEERKRIFQKWGIALNSKRRRLQLISRLWSSPEDMNHIMESAAIVAKLVRFVEQGHVLKGMFGLTFTPTKKYQRSYSWKNSLGTLF